MPTTHYIWDTVSDSYLMETDESGNITAEYITEPVPHGRVISQLRNGTTSFYHYDGEGSTRQLTDESGNVTDEYTYSAFGETVASSGTIVNSFQWVGAIGYYLSSVDSSYYIRRRTYWTAIARWLSTDPLGINSDHWNLYGYARGNPLSLADPSGLLCVRNGPLFYESCGKAYMGAQFHLTPEERQTGGFVVQKVVTKYYIYGCCVNPDDFQGSDKCPVFTRRSDPSSVVESVYWELFPIMNKQDGYTLPDHWGIFAPFTPSTGNFTQRGYAWFHPANVPPAADWQKDLNSPARQLAFSCTEPFGDPGEAMAPISRSINLSWSCCGGSSGPFNELGLELKGVPVPGSPGVVQYRLPEGEFYSVTGRCKDPAKGV